MNLENVDDVYRLTPIQEGILFHSISEPESGVFVQQIEIDIVGLVKLDFLQKAWSELVENHSVLRTMFVWDGLDEPLQLIRSHVELDWQIEYLSGPKSSSSGNRVEDFLYQDRKRGFALESAPLMRLALFKKAEREFKLIWTFHHLILDGWSTSLLLKEVFETYASLALNSALKPQRKPERSFNFKEFVASVLEFENEGVQSYWKSQLAGFRSVEPIHDRFDSKGPKDGTQPRLVDQSETFLTETGSESLRSFSTRNRITLNSLFLGGWAYFVSQYTGQTDVVFGTTVSGRSPDIPNVDIGIGLFINTLPIRIRLNTEEGLADWLKKIQSQQIQTRQYERCSLPQIQRWSEVPANQNLFDSIVVFENYPESGEWNLGDLDFEVSKIQHHEQSNYPLALLVVPGNRIRLILVRDPSHFSDLFCRRMLDHLKQVLTCMILADTKSVGDLEMLSNEELSEIDLESYSKFPFKPESGVNCIDLFQSAVDSYPNEVAISAGKSSLNYEQLSQLSDQLADQLQALGIQDGDHVGLMVTPGLDLAIGIIGILKSGAAYVPLDPEYPVGHLQFICNDSQIKLLVCGEKIESALQVQRVSIPKITDQRSPFTNTPKSIVSNESPAYLIYTSGSQGKPKGVRISHDNLAYSTLARKEYYQETPNNYLLLSSFAFDSSVAGIFWTPCFGGTLFVPPDKIEQDMEALGDFILENRISHLLCLPSLYYLMLEQNPDNLNSLDVVILAGEVCHPNVVKRHIDRMPNTKLFNEYGPTEASVWSTVARVDNETPGNKIPIGIPIPGAKIQVLGPSGKMVPDGVSGEVCISGPGVASGYWNRSTLSDQKFVRGGSGTEERFYRTGDRAYRRLDGQLVFDGRMDEQVKIRGFRIELNEIANHVLAHSGIRESVAVVRHSHSDRIFKSVDEILYELGKLGPSQASLLLELVESGNASESVIKEAK
ncbi:MAG: amino acid adenylation domain-containing protein [Planctomycetota bacterium]